MTWTKADLSPLLILCPHCPQPWPAFKDQEAINAHAKAEHPEAWAWYEKMKNVTVRTSWVEPK
jgi:hypothetical protein